jgi:3',5'-cyclic AMP phosphodiesterase CpdA
MRTLAVAAAFMLHIGGCATVDVRTAPRETPKVLPLNVVAAGDIAECSPLDLSNSNAARTAALIEPSDLIVLTLGDNAYPDGTPTQFSDCFHPSWGRFKDRIRPSVGNHDYRTPGAAGYFDYFGDRAGPGRRGYYSFDVAGWHFISLNSNIDASVGSAQYAWLEDDLAASSTALCTLAYWHHPVFTSGPHGNNARMAGVFNLLHAAGTEIVLVGHDHVYERFAPQDAAGQSDPQRGVRSFTVGTGGARLYSFRAIRPNSEARDDTTHGVLRLALESAGYRWAFVPAGGGPRRDEGAARCHR